MQKNTLKSNTVATGLAMFSMFFGAGNVVFPLALGRHAQDKNFYAILGLLITAVGVPFLGLIAMTLFDGNYKQFFFRIGKIPGFIAAAIILGLIGPFGAIPRCIALSYGTIQTYLPDLSLPLFSLASCFMIYLFSFRAKRILDLLGYILTPLLLGALAVIIIKGLLTASDTAPMHSSPMEVFLKGLQEGYQTMDLLGAFFFSSVVLLCLKKGIPNSAHRNHKMIIKQTLKASCIGAFLLALIYIGFSYIAAFHANGLESAAQEVLLGAIAHKILGAYAGLVASVAVALACLTTAIALAAVFGEFIQNDLSLGYINYQASLILTLAISFVISTLEFTGIIAFLAPILFICYPALITLSLLNITYKLHHFQSVKIPVFTVFFTSALVYFFAW